MKLMFICLKLIMIEFKEKYLLCYLLDQKWLENPNLYTYYGNGKLSNCIYKYVVGT